MKKLILLLLLFSTYSITFSAVDPFYKDVLQRGYELIPGDSVRFPDGSTCSISAFNNLECGQKWMTDDYCVEEGEMVWDDNRCCDGLEPYLEEGVDGQQTCQKKSSIIDDISSFFSSSTILYFFIGVLIPLGLFVILAASIKKRLPKKDE